VGAMVQATAASAAEGDEPPPPPPPPDPPAVVLPAEPRPRSNSCPACELSHAVRSARTCDDLLAVEPVAFVLQPAYARATASLNSSTLPRCPLRAMFPNYTDNAAVAAELAGRPDMATVDRVLFHGDAVPSPLYWTAQWDVLQAESPVPLRAEGRESVTGNNGNEDNNGHSTAIERNGASTRAEHEHEYAARKILCEGALDSPERRDEGGVSSEHTPNSANSARAARTADYRSNLYREGRAEVARLRQLQTTAAHSSHSDGNGHGDSGTNNGGGNNTANSQRLSPPHTTKYTEQTDSEVLQHLMIQLRVERERADEATRRAEGLEAALAEEKRQRQESDESCRLMRSELVRHREEAQRTIEVANKLERENVDLREKYRVTQRDLEETVHRLQQVHESAASHATAPLEAELRRARDENTAHLERLGKAGVDLATARKAAAKERDEFGREKARLEADLSTVREQLKRSQKRAEEQARALQDHQRETHGLITQTEAQLKAARLITAGVIQEEEEMRRQRWVEREAVVRAQLVNLEVADRNAL
jgi:hypothetical protein